MHWRVGLAVLPGNGISTAKAGSRDDTLPHTAAVTPAAPHLPSTCHLHLPPAGDHERNLSPAVVRPSTHSMREPGYQLKGPPLQPEVGTVAQRSAAGGCMGGRGHPYMLA